MPSSNASSSNQTRTYDRASSVVFLKTNEAFGGLSNMAGGFPLRVNGVRILTSEALYQACRFPHRPEVQALIIEQNSPMTAKMKGKPYRNDSRPDWDHVRVKIMRWCLRVKLAQNWRPFSALLLQTGERPIVEESRKDDFWGAKPTGDGRTLVGMNVLGRLLMELRETVKTEDRESLMHVKPLGIPDFMLGGWPIEIVASQVHERSFEPGKVATSQDRGDADGRAYRQPSLFDGAVAKKAHPAAYSAVDAKSVHVADLKPYAEYKESGLPWLGQVPGHWNIKRGKSHLTPIDQRSRAGKEELLTVSSARGVVPRSSANVTMFKAESYTGHKLCWPGDLVINSLWAWGGGLGVSQHHGIISTAYSVYRSRPSAQINPRFLHELVRSTSFHWELQVRSKGVWISRLQLTDTAFLDAPIPLPPLNEQASIVRFLDWANGRLDRAIRAKRKVMALLNEQKQAIVHRAVTRGLDPDVPLRPSGIPWLGDVPKHWEVLPLKSVSRIQSGLTLGKDYSGKMLHEFPYLRVANVQAGHVKLSVVKTVRVTKAEAQRCLLQRGDVLMTEGGDLDKLGRGCVWEAQVSPCLHQNHVFAVRPNQICLVPSFLSALMGVGYARAYFQSTAKQTTNLAATNKTKVGMFKVLLPSVAEQLQILEKLEEETRPLTAATARLEREIELLREYRTRLVADVVTGKLDVREAAARLPDEAAPDLAEDDAEIAEELDSEAEDVAA